MASDETHSNNGIAKSADVTLKFLGDFALVPGASQFMNGELGSGVIHVVAGVAGGALLGPIGWGLAAADSFTKSITGNNIWMQATAATNRGAGATYTKFKKDLNAALAKDPNQRSSYEQSLVDAEFGVGDNASRGVPRTQPARPDAPASGHEETEEVCVAKTSAARPSNVERSQEAKDDYIMSRLEKMEANQRDIYELLKKVVQ